MSSSARAEYRPDPEPEEFDNLEKIRTPTPPQDHIPAPREPKDPRSKAKYNIFSRIFFL